jgi:photosystem II stability/assembly factor-like uncharacterized protein
MSLRFSLYCFRNYWKHSKPGTALLNLPQENAINDIARIPGTEKIVAVGEGSTVMYSDDMGESWDVNCNPAGLNNFANLKSVIFTDASLGFITTADGQILRTSDGGNQWSVVHTTSPENPLNDIHFSMRTMELFVAITADTENNQWRRRLDHSGKRRYFTSERN